MLDRLLIPLDGSVSGERVLGFLPLLVAGRDRQVTLARIVVPGTSAPRHDLQEALLQLADIYLKRVETSLSLRCGTIRTTTAIGPAAGSLLAIARATEASLLVLSTHGERGDSRSAFGSTTLDLIRTSPLPLFLTNPLLPFGAEKALQLLKNRKIGHILVVSDPGDLPGAVLPEATVMAETLGLEVVLLQVVPPKSTGRGEAESRASAEDRLGGLARTFQERRIPVEPVIQGGDPATVVLNVLREREAGLVVMGGPRAMSHPGAEREKVFEAVLQGAPSPLLLAASPPPEAF